MKGTIDEPLLTEHLVDGNLGQEGEVAFPNVRAEVAESKADIPLKVGNMTIMTRLEVSDRQ